jgi:hypothetical protein
MPARCARTDEVAVCLRDHGHPGLCVSPEMSANPQLPAGHTIDLQPEQNAYEVCLHCGKAIQVDVYGSGRLVTMIGRNAECYGK